MSQTQADAEMTRLNQLYPLFADEPSILVEWQRLVSLYGAMGKQNHDARLVAAMNVHHIATILTFNKSDFIRYPGIIVFTPVEILSTTSGGTV